MPEVLRPQIIEQDGRQFLNMGLDQMWQDAERRADNRSAHSLN